MNTFDIHAIDTGERLSRRDAPDFGFFDTWRDMSDEALQAHIQERAANVGASHETSVQVEASKESNAIIRVLGHVCRNAYNSGRLLHP